MNVSTASSGRRAPGRGSRSPCGRRQSRRGGIAISRAHWIALSSPGCRALAGGAEAGRDQHAGAFSAQSGCSAPRSARKWIEVELRKTIGNGQYRVLIADDEDNFAELLATVLEGDGRFEVLGRARDGKEALELVFALAPDLVLMDIDMPVMDGVEATSRIHRRRPDLPIVAISGLDYSERGLEARLAGAAEYLCKAKLDTDLAGVLGGVLADTQPLPTPDRR